MIPRTMDNRPGPVKYLGIYVGKEKRKQEKWIGTTN